MTCPDWDMVTCLMFPRRIFALKIIDSLFALLCSGRRRGVGPSGRHEGAEHDPRICQGEPTTEATTRLCLVRGGSVEQRSTGAELLYCLLSLLDLYLASLRPILILAI